MNDQPNQAMLWSSLDEKQKEELGSILQLINSSAPDDFPIKQLYADYLIATERYPQALPILEELSVIQPMRGLQAAALSRRLGNNATADRYAIRALDEVSRMSKEDPTNSVLALAVAQNQLFLKRFNESVTTLDRAIQRAPDEKSKAQLQLAIGDAIASWVGHIEASAEEGVTDRLRILTMLRTALKYAPSNPRVVMLVADQVLATADNKDEQIAAVRQALISGSDAGIAHFIRGTAALIKNDVENATTSLKLAAQHMPRSSAILNNLAVALTIRENPNLEQALRISETAISETKNPTPHFFETRGQIYFRMNRYRDAIPDLERALEVEELAKNAHEALATCYQEIGEAELSTLHSDAAAEL